MILALQIGLAQLLCLLVVEAGIADLGNALRQLSGGVQGGQRDGILAAKLDDGPIEQPVIAPALLVFRCFEKILLARLTLKKAIDGRLKWFLKHLQADPEALITGKQRLDDLKLHAVAQVAVVRFTDADDVGLEEA